MLLLLMLSEMLVLVLPMVISSEQSRLGIFTAPPLPASRTTETVSAAARGKGGISAQHPLRRRYPEAALSCPWTGWQELATGGVKVLDKLAHFWSKDR